MAADFCWRTKPLGERFAPSSFWWRAERRTRAVVAMAMPMEPPMLRSMLKRPVALPISSRVNVEVLMVARGTKTKLRAKPVRRIGTRRVYGPMERLTVPKTRAQRPKATKPAESSLRLSMREPRNPMMGEPMKDPMPRGPTTRPAVNAV